MAGTAWLTPLTGSRLVRRIADTAMVRAGRHRVRQLDRTDPAMTQERTLFQLLRQAERTQFGRDHDFSFLQTVSEYQSRVPLRDYDDFWNGYWKDAYPKLDDITWPGHIPYYALSSGTTSGTTKYIPISHAMLKSNRKAAFTTMALFRNAFPHHDTFTGKFFFLGGCTDMRPQADGSFAGDLSGIAAKEVIAASRPFTYPALDISLIPDWPVKLQKLAAQSIHEPITALSGVPSWMLTLFDRIKQESGKKTIAEIWPQLKLIVHGGTKFDSYRNTFRTEIGSDDVQFCEVYPCSEGFIATEDPRYNLLRLVPDHGIFFEFIPVEDLRDGKSKTDKPARHTLRTVQTGVVYAIAVTTCAGLWSYLIGDTVTFESVNPPLVRFSGRTKNFLSAFGEHLIEEEIEKGIAKAAEACGVLTADHHVGPIFPTEPKKPGHHLYLIEFRGSPPRDLARFTEVLDDELRRLNEDYDAHRVGDLTMLRPEVRPVREGAFARWMVSRGKEGGQNKVPRMDNDGIMTVTLRDWLTRNEG